MKIHKFENKDQWLLARRGKITGTRLKDIIVKRGTKPKIGYYELIAERLAVEPDGEDRMERGLRLEDEAIERFKKETGKEIVTELVIWSRDENESIALTPDGFVSETEAVEVKCLNSARHLEAYLTNEIPDEYKMQALQYFIVNDLLAKLNVVFYDPRILCKDYFVIEINRPEVQKEVEEYLEYQRKTLEKVNEIVLELSNF